MEKRVRKSVYAGVCTRTEAQYTYERGVCMRGGRRAREYAYGICVSLVCVRADRRARVYAYGICVSMGYVRVGRRARVYMHTEYV